jgi:hypothetical protein
MNDIKFKLFVCPLNSLKDNNISNIGGLIFNSDVHNFELIKKTLESMNEDWVMVDYNNRNNLLLSSLDKPLNLNVINKYFNPSRRNSSITYNMNWDKNTNDFVSRAKI